MATPSIRLTGDKTEAANWIRRGRTELERLRTILQNAEVPTSTRTIEFNDDVRCNVYIGMGVERIEIYARPPGKEVEEEEEDVVEEEHFKCYPGFMVYRDGNGYKWNPDAEPPAYEKVADAGELLTHNGTKFVRAETNYKAGGKMAWYHLKDNLGKYNRGGEYKRCSLVSWNGLPWGTSGWPSESFSPGNFYFQGQGYSAGSTGFVVGACILPGQGSDSGTDYFHVLVQNGWWYNSGVISQWQGRSYTLKKAPVKLPPESNLLSWETIKFWDEYDEVAPLQEWTNAISPFGGTCSGPNCGAYIDKDGKASMTVTSIAGQDYTDSPAPGTYRTANGIQGSLYGSPMPFYVQKWGSQTIWKANFRSYACISFDMNFRNGAITNIVDNSRAAVQPWQYRHTRNEMNSPVLGLGVLPTQHMYCGPLGGSGSERSDLVDFTKPADNGRYKKWDKQGHQERDTPTTSSTTFESYGGKETMCAIFGGADALYTMHINMTNYSNQGSGSGTSERHRWGKTGADPDGIDAYPVWSWSTSRGGSVDDFTGEFIVRKNGNDHFKLTLHENRIDINGTHGASVTWSVSSSVFAHAAAPFNGLGSNEPDFKTATVRSNSATSFAIQRSPVFYHPMINKALYFERHVHTYLSGVQYADPQQSGTIFLKWGSEENAETLGQWSGLEAEQAGDYLHFMLLSSWWYGGTNLESSVHCNGEANPGPTKDIETWGLNGSWGLWAQDKFSALGGHNSILWRPEYNGGNEGGGFGSSPKYAFFNSLPGHEILRYDSNAGTTQTWYPRVCYAVHHESPASGGEPAYIIFFPKLHMTDTTPETMLRADFSSVDPGSFSMDDEFNEETPEYWYFSNCMTLEELKETAGRDTDYPVDFGVV